MCAREDMRRCREGVGEGGELGRGATAVGFSVELGETFGSQFPSFPNEELGLPVPTVVSYRNKAWSSGSDCEA